MLKTVIAALGATLLTPHAADLGGSASQPPLQPGEVNIRMVASAAAARDYPVLARRAGVEGEAVAVCSIVGDGSLTACKIQRESPADYGFGAALLQTAEQVRVDPMTRNGAPTAGRAFRLAMRFHLPTDQAAAPATHE